MLDTLHSHFKIANSIHFTILKTTTLMNLVFLGRSFYHFNFDVRFVESLFEVESSVSIKSNVLNESSNFFMELMFWNIYGYRIFLPN